MEKPFFEFRGSFYKQPYDISNVNNDVLKENFPLCCKYHKSLYKGLNGWFEKFPDCCERHKKMKEEFWFNKSNLADLPLKIVRQLSYTANHLILKKNENDWREEFEDYLAYNIDSFGIPAIGDDRYLDGLRYFLNNHAEADGLRIEQKDFLLKIIDNYFVPSHNVIDHEKSNFSETYEVWQNWLDIFPFNLSPFVEFKAQFSKQIPLLNGGVKINRYTGIAVAQMQTKASLIESIVNLTKSLLLKVDSSKD